MKKAKARTDKGRAVAVSAGPALKPWHYWAALATAFLAVSIVYWPAVDGPFVFDDLYLPFTAPEMASAPLSHWVGGLRPLLMFSFWINHSISGMQTFSYHFLNLLLHLATGAFAFLIVRKFLDRAGESGWKREGLAAFAAGLFLLHPLQTESVAYVASRSETLSVMFFYAAFALFLYRRSEAIGWLESLGVVALFAAAASTKEHAAVLPALLLLTDFFWSSWRGIRRNWRLYAILAAAAAAALRMVWHVLARQQHRRLFRPGLHLGASTSIRNAGPSGSTSVCSSCPSARTSITTSRFRKPLWSTGRMLGLAALLVAVGRPSITAAGSRWPPTAS